MSHSTELDSTHLSQREQPGAIAQQREDVAPAEWFGWNEIDANGRPIGARYGYVSIMVAMKTGNCDIINRALMNVDVNHTTSTGDTLFTLATSYGHLNVMKSLLLGKANILHANLHNRTAVHIASDQGYTSVVEWLIANNADVNCVGYDSMTPLHGAARFNHVQVVKLLLESNAAVDQMDRFGRTALHHTTRKHSSNEMVTLLLDHNANVDHVDRYKNTALANAIHYHRPEIVKTLLARGASMSIHAKDQLEVPRTFTMDDPFCRMMVEVLLPHQLFESGREFCDPALFRQFPQSLQNQCIVLTRLWSARLDNTTNTLALLSIELLYVLLCTLCHVHFDA